MSLIRIKETFLRLSKHTKLIGLGSLILLISTLLPWYADVAFKTTEQFLGITGPTSFIGIMIILFSSFSLWLLSYRLLERRMPRLPFREAIFHLAVGIESLFLLLLVNSIYFHPNFGYGIKESRFGMTIAFVGAIVLLVGAYFQNREEIMEEKDSGRLEPLIKLEPEKPQSSEPTTQPLYQRQHEPLPKRPQQHTQSGRTYASKGFVFGEKPKGIVPEPPSQNPKSQVEEKNEGSGSYMIRMDL